jgi:hypothetical protein
MTTKEEEVRLIVFDSANGAEQLAAIFEGIGEIYDSNKNLLAEMRLKAPPPLAELLDVLLIYNEMERKIILDRWRKFCDRHFRKVKEA